jgi:hypothetical protein
MVFGKQEEGGTQGAGESHFSVTVTATTAEGFKQSVKELVKLTGGNPNGDDNGDGEEAHPEPR